MKAAHYITLILWAFGIVNLFEPFNGPLFYISSAIFYLLLIAHVVECFVYRDKILKSKDIWLALLKVSNNASVIFLVSSIFIYKSFLI